MSKSISDTCSELGIFTHWTSNSMYNTSSYCGLVDAKIRTSDKDLPVISVNIFRLVHTDLEIIPRFKAEFPTQRLCCKSINQWVLMCK